MKTFCYRGVPVLGIVAFSGTGKTTLLKNMIPILQKKGIRVGVVKHTHHDFDIDHPGKDSYEIRKSGAQQMIVGSKHRQALVVETPDKTKHPLLTDYLDNFKIDLLDIILVEGFRHEAYPKIELNRSRDSALLCEKDNNVIALFSDRTDIGPLDIPNQILGEYENHAEFVESYMHSAVDEY